MKQIERVRRNIIEEAKRCEAYLIAADLMKHNATAAAQYRAFAVSASARAFQFAKEINQ